MRVSFTCKRQMSDFFRQRCLISSDKRAFFHSPRRSLRPPSRAAAGAEIVRDSLLPDVLLLPAGSRLHGNPWVDAGKLILQGRASCIPAHVLAPQPGWTVVDACAAPGNKTTHLAARMQGRGRVLAFDADRERLNRLKVRARALLMQHMHACCI